MNPKSESNRDRSHHLGRLLLELSKDFVASSNDRLRKRGYEFIGATHIRVLSQIADQGTELSVVINRVGLSKQGINKIIRQLEAADIITLEVNPLDSRSRIIQFTKAGKKFLGVGLEAIDELEEEYIKVLGKKDFVHLKTSLVKVAEARQVMHRIYESEES
jgi:DNA-binding MarR family transcriptional regulator